jgi:hypothetical protein
MDPIEFQLLLLEENALRETRTRDPRARKRMRAGEICSSCRRPLPKPHTPVFKRCASCAGKHHVRITFFHFDGWHCRFFTEHWQPLPRRITFRDAASIKETARRGDGLTDDAMEKSLDRQFKLGRGGIMLRLTDEQFRAIGGVPPPDRVTADKSGAKEDISSEAGFSPNLS